MRRVWRAAALCVLVSATVLGVSALAGGAAALADTAWWSITPTTMPASLTPGGEGKIVVRAVNVGDAAANGEAQPISIRDVLPAGVVEQGVSLFVRKYGFHDVGALFCKHTGVECVIGLHLAPYEQLEMVVAVKVEEDVSVDSDNSVTITGGETADAVSRQPLSVSEIPPRFGIEDFTLTPEEEGGDSDVQAGSHPFQLTTTVAVSQGAQAGQPPALVKDLQFNLPRGLLGDPKPIAQCGEAEFATVLLGGSNRCPADTMVGVAIPSFTLGGEGVIESYPVPIFNLEPTMGEPARFGFEVHGYPVILDTAVRTGGDYGVSVSTKNVTQAVSFLSTTVVFWGVPGDARHDAARGWACLEEGAELPPESTEACTPTDQPHPAAFLRLPTACGSVLAATAEGDSWSAPGKPAETVSAVPSTPRGGSAPVQPLDGCDRLPFDPTFSAATTTEQASTPTGLAVDVKVPEDGEANAAALAESDVESTAVTLPEGLTLNPAGANGLQACTDGPEEARPEGEIALRSASASTCPQASKVATVKIKTPLLPEALVGGAYLAAQYANPFDALVALYIVAEAPRAGVLVKLAGQVTLNAQTGQLVSTFAETPQLPFEELELEFFGGSSAPLSTPPLCGQYAARAVFTPWSGTDSVQSGSEFAITSGSGGAQCQSPQPFSPSFTAGTSDVQAGAFTPFVTALTRPDADQALGGISLHMPPGLAGMLSSVKLCEEPQAAAGTCGPESLIGRTAVSAGLGSDPYAVEAGQVFITGPTDGAPFGLSIVNPAVAGPFDLGTIVVRARIEIDPRTAALTVTTTAPLPTLLDGIPLQLQHVDVTIERPGFAFNPTSCDRLALTGTITGSAGASADVSSPFQVTDCAALGFAAKFSVSTSGKTSRLRGASLDVKLTYPKAAQGTQANLAKARVELPKKLPSRLKTLQKACAETTFAANPASCPAASRVGSAIVHTPVLPVALAGPAYFVSHGNAKFPELIVVLQGDGVTIDLHGETFISKRGITSSTFAQTPDVPFSSFELKLPEGPYSALAAVGDLCKKRSLGMPTELVAQNGAVIRKTTKVSISGCRKAARSRARRRSRRR
jgi:hypothetical protein